MPSKKSTRYGPWQGLQYQTTDRARLDGADFDVDSSWGQVAGSSTGPTTTSITSRMTCGELRPEGLAEARGQSNRNPNERHLTSQRPEVLRREPDAGADWARTNEVASGTQNRRSLAAGSRALDGNRAFPAFLVETGVTGRPDGKQGP